MPKSEVTSNGLKRALKKKGYKPASSIAEYIWNGFDAEATCIEIKGSYIDVIGGIISFSITDNGTGIVDSNSFGPLFESEKNKLVASKSRPKRHGDSNRGNSLGRLTFFTFARQADWHTVYEDQNNVKYKYEIHIDSSSLVKWIPSKLEETDESSGTSVVFSDISENFTDVNEKEITDYLKYEFAWYLEQRPNSYKVIINGEPLNYTGTILEKTEETRKIGEYEFNFKLILWNRKLNDEYSRYYFLNSKGYEAHSITTTLNNKGDGFFHSLYIMSDFFDEFNPDINDLPQSDNQNIFASDERNKIYGRLIQLAEEYLFDRRTPFIEAAAEKLINYYEGKKIFPEYGSSELDNFKKTNIYNMVKQIYQVEPKIFKSLTMDQSKIFIRFLDVILVSGQTEEIFKILKEVISLDAADLKQFAKTLISTRLTNVIKTIQLIEDRYKAINDLKRLVFNREEFNANEPQHIQKIIESHYWIFGEQYNLVAAEESSFQKVLEGYVDILRKANPDNKGIEETDNLTIDHPSRRKQMDIFMCRQNIDNKSVHHVVLELKHPRISLGKHELDQVKEYMEVILSKEQFNANNAVWDFYLIGNKFARSRSGDDSYIEREIISKSNSGEPSLAFSYKNYKIYVKTWSEIFNEFDIKYKFIQEKLDVERHRLIEEEDMNMRTADDVVEHAENLTSSRPGAVIQSKKQRAKSQKNRIAE
jgi:hypothetical protein